MVVRVSFQRHQIMVKKKPEKKMQNKSHNTTLSYFHEPFL